MSSTMNATVSNKIGLVLKQIYLVLIFDFDEQAGQ